jgi:hypothetical protein
VVAVSEVQLPDYEVRYAESDEELRAALVIEDEVFREKHFLPVGDLYEPYLPQSFVIGAFTDDGACLGVMRMIESMPLLPPMLHEAHHVAIAYEPEKWQKLAQDGVLDECATIAVPQRNRSSTVTMDLIRFGYRHARHLISGDFGTRPPVDYIAAILAPSVAWGLRLKWFFPFQQVGPEQHYMEGTPYREEVVTAPYILDLSLMEQRWATECPEYYGWVREGQMSDHVPPPMQRIRRDSPLLAGYAPLDENAS